MSKIQYHNVETGVVVSLEPTQKQLAEMQKVQSEIETKLAARESLDLKKREILTKLGLSLDEVEALLQ